MWRKRNPAVKSEINALELNTQRRIFEKCLTDDEIDIVVHELSQGENLKANQEGSVDINQEGNVEDITLICKSVCINCPLNKSIQFINMTMATKGIHQVCVCLICDYFIIGTEPIFQLTNK